MNEMLKTLGSIISAERMRIPECNRTKFDAEAGGLFREVRSALEIHDKTRIRALLAFWSRRLTFLLQAPSCHFAPPFLLRKKGETIEEHVNRCYEQGGF